VAGDRAEVRDGLAPGERIVMRGAFNLHDGDRVTVVSSEARQAATGS
jgi:multidrug efflux pump subunit AcrA (membrane-fusion protein)